jgi:hypothetical protein
MKLHIPTALKHTKVTLVVGILAFWSVVGVMGASGVFSGHHNAGKPVQPTKNVSYKQTLQNQVDTSDGQPRDGRDPGSQSQTSLMQAASSPHGNGMQTDTPASGVSGSNHPQTTSADIYGDPSKTGINAAGCYIDYGIQGQECLQADMANSDGSMGCDMVRMEFPNGIKVTGKDRFNLDHNQNKIACDSGD